MINYGAAFLCCLFSFPYQSIHYFYITKTTSKKVEDKDLYDKLTELAVLQEKVKRLEAFIYGGLGLIFLQLIGMFILWAKEVLSK